MHIVDITDCMLSVSPVAAGKGANEALFAPGGILQGCHLKRKNKKTGNIGPIGLGCRHHNLEYASVPSVFASQ